MSVLLETSAGNMVVDLYEDAEGCSMNFIKLCKAKYYNFSPFYDVQRDFAVECGDPHFPLSDGGHAVTQLTSQRRLMPVRRSHRQHDDIGLVSFLNFGTTDSPLIGSRFLITLTDDKTLLKDLDTSGVVFGKVVEGFQTLQSVNEAIIDSSRRPIKDIRIFHTYVLDDPYPDPVGFSAPSVSPRPDKAQLSTFQLVYEEDQEKEEELNHETTREEQMRETQAQSQALTLELLGDLPSADFKPMENVLFVCKLNPLTQEEDLKTIFSRFGKILSCEVIKDKVTGSSLQYAFIEFDSKEACERAYFKMDNVLIDDRRIHVDFSQSVRKLSDSWRRDSERKIKGNFQSRGNRGGYNKPRGYRPIGQ
ncbi:unnamed protein product [Kuraishia capsulata CBS 1993]|uniref:Peptidyl-prolyl cis-trans isomerase n=1 Tax=Kuraishia capsulata CBS 1993 TaxID=1382522 RepID=W6MW40_9ASCO|nr:uncharacterized protein KUCA_T00002839001 [Kuraishia capsulata CBS 1993]CDK26865.1 unnamed protein product [Kuraishia capsulata CBS 1993]